MLTRAQVFVTSQTNLGKLKLPNPIYLYEVTIEQESVEDKEIRLTWDKSHAADFREYKIYRHTSSGLDEATGELIHVVTSADDTTFLTSAPHNAHFFYRVFVMNAFGKLGGSNTQDLAAGPFVNSPAIILDELKRLG